MAEIINFLSNATVLAVLVGYIFSIWLGLTIWTYVDISRRTDNYPYRFAMVLLVAFGAFVGFAFYLMIRPSMTQAEIASQRLEEKFLAASAAYAFCGTCGEPAGSEFNFCVNCGTELRKTCGSCSYRLIATWLACPNCGKMQGPEALPEIVVKPAPVAEVKNVSFLQGAVSKISFDWVGAFLRSVSASRVSSSKNGDSRKIGKNDEAKPKSKKKSQSKARVSSRTA